MFMVNEQYGEGFEVEEYHGIYSLVSKQQGKDGTVYVRWCEVEIGPEKRKQKIPLSVRLGSDKDGAIAALNEIIANLGGSDKEVVPF